MEEPRRLLLHGFGDVRVRMSDVETADAAGEVEERVAVDVGERRAAAFGGDDRQVHRQGRGDDGFEAGEDLPGAGPWDLRL